MIRYIVYCDPFTDEVQDNYGNWYDSSSEFETVRMDEEETNDER